jgi:hypothetical protein
VTNSLFKITHSGLAVELCTNDNNIHLSDRDSLQLWKRGLGGALSWVLSLYLHSARIYFVFPDVNLQSSCVIDNN